MVHDFSALYDFPLDDFQLRACREIEDGRGVLVAAPTGSGKTVVGEFAIHLALDDRPQVLLHDADQGAVQPEVPRPRRPLRRRPGRAADRRQRRQRRGAGGRDDHRGAPQHALRRLPDPARPRLRGHGRGALPRRPLPRRRVGGGHHPPPRVGDRGQPVRDGLQRRGVRRVAGDRPRRDHHDRRGAPAGPALPARDGRPAAARPVRVLRRRRGRRLRQGGRPGQRRADEGRPRRLGQHPPDARPSLAAQGQAGLLEGQVLQGRAQRRQRPPGLDPQPGRRRRPARPRGAAAGDRLHLQPGRLRRRRPAVPQRRRPADHARRSATRSTRTSRPPATTCPTRTCTSSATTTSSTG